LPQWCSDVFDAGEYPGKSPQEIRDAKLGINGETGKPKIRKPLTTDEGEAAWFGSVENTITVQNNGDKTLKNVKVELFCQIPEGEYVDESGKHYVKRTFTIETLTPGEELSFSYLENMAFETSNVEGPGGLGVSYLHIGEGNFGYLHYRIADFEEVSVEQWDPEWVETWTWDPEEGYPQTDVMNPPE
jgi:hypothetical protein